MHKPVSVLFLCTGNSCRSIMAEALLSHHGGESFIANSAGSFPTGEVHSKSLQTLEQKGVNGDGYRSKSWDEFIDKKIDIVITVCDSAAGESCPIFPGKPLKAHWGVPDPAKFTGSEQDIAAEFLTVCNVLERRIKALTEMDIENADDNYVQKTLREISEIM